MNQQEKSLNKQTSKEEDMARCCICGGRVTGERGGLAHYRGRPCHKSCLREKLNQMRRPIRRDFWERLGRW